MIIIQIANQPPLLVDIKDGLVFNHGTKEFIGKTYELAAQFERLADVFFHADGWIPAHGGKKRRKK